MGRLQGVEVAKLEFALLRLMIQLRKYGDFYRAGCRKNFIGVKKIFLSGRQIKNGDSEDAIKIAVHPADGRFQLLPQHLLFLLGRLFLRNLLRAGWHGGIDRNDEQRKQEKSFQHSDLPGQRDYKANGRKCRKTPGASDRTELRAA